MTPEETLSRINEALEKLSEMGAELERMGSRLRPDRHLRGADEEVATDTTRRENPPCLRGEKP